MQTTSPPPKTPDTALLMAALIVAAALLTWILPAGTYERETIDVPGAGTREVAVPGTFRHVELTPAGTAARVRQTVALVFAAPIRGFTDPEVVPIIAFVLLIGGAFAALQATGAVDAGLWQIVHASRRSRFLERLVIPLCMTLFSLGGAVFGMAEEIVPFVLIFVPLARALGYDALTGAAIPFLGAAAGFAAAVFNPFTVGVAQGIAGLPPFSGAGFRAGLWLVTTTLVIAFVMWHAHRIRTREARTAPGPDAAVAAPAAGPVAGRVGGPLGGEPGAMPLTRRRRAVLALFAAGMVVLVWGVLPPERGGQGWYIVEIAALFVALGVGVGVVGGLGARGTSTAFMDGIRQLAPTAALIGLARGIVVILRERQVIDTILHGLASALEGTTATGAAIAMFAVQTVINVIMPSGSGQAALTMPLMAPLADLVGVTRQTAVLAFQMGDGFTNMIVPTSPVLLGVLALAGISWLRWARWILPLQILLFALGMIVLAVAVRIGY